MELTFDHKLNPRVVCRAADMSDILCRKCGGELATVAMKQRPGEVGEDHLRQNILESVKTWKSQAATKNLGTHPRNHGLYDVLRCESSLDDAEGILGQASNYVTTRDSSGLDGVFLPFLSHVHSPSFPFCIR